MRTVKILQFSLLLVAAVSAQKTKVPALSEALLERLGYSESPDFSSDIKFILNGPPPPMDRSLRPTSYYTPPVNQSPRYAYKKAYENKYLKKRASYKKTTYVKPTFTKKLEDRPNPPIQVFLYERGSEKSSQTSN